MKPFTAESGRWRIAVMRLVLFCLVFNVIFPQPVAGLEVLQGTKPATLDPVLLKKIRSVVTPKLVQAQTKTAAAASASASATNGVAKGKPAKNIANVELALQTSTASAAIAADTSAEDEWEDFLCEDSEAVEFEDQEISADSVALGPLAPKPLNFSAPKRIKTPPAQVLQYAKNFWDEADHQIEKRNINISGTKTFEMKQAEISGDVGHFSTENYDSYPAP